MFKLSNKHPKYLYQLIANHRLTRQLFSHTPGGLRMLDDDTSISSNYRQKWNEVINAFVSNVIKVEAKRKNVQSKSEPKSTRFCFIISKPVFCYQESMENCPSSISQLTLIKFIAFELQVNFATLFSSEILSPATSDMQRRSECLEDGRNVLLVFPITTKLHHRPAIDWLTIKLTLFCLSMSASAFN